MKHLLWLSLAVFACSAAKVEQNTDPGADAGEDTAINTSGMELVKGLPITEIALFQGPKVSLEKAGARVDSRRAPVIAGRPGVLRVFVAPAGDWAPREVVATLTLEGGSGKKVLSDKKALSGPSVDDVLDSTFNFDIGTDMIAPDTKYSVTLKTEPGQTAGGDTAAAQYPADGSVEDLSAKATGEKLRVKIVPVKYMADGSGRLPDTSEAQIERYRKGFQKLYPAREVEVTVRAPYSWSTAISRTGSGFSNLLNAIIRLRQTDGAERGVYYYGAFAAGATMESWCQYSCVLGLSPVAQNPSDTWTAGSVGGGWTGEGAVGTAVHEVGHGHGRGHSPCAPGGMIDGVDRSYPYTGATLGVWAYDIENKSMVSPSKSKDFMGYCDPTFVSDYTFGALATRMAFVYGAAYMIPGPTQTYRIVNVDGDGKMTDGEELVTNDLITGTPTPVAVALDDGKKVPVTAAWYPWDHLHGGMLVVPVGAAKVAAIEARDVIPGIASKLTLVR